MGNHPIGVALEVENASDAESAPVTPKRINVAVNQKTLAAIEHVVESEQVSLTEAVRKLVSYGDYCYRAVNDQSATLIIREPDGSAKEIVLV